MKAPEDGKFCYQFKCDRYPTCLRARGKGCCLDDWDDSPLTVTPEECGNDNGWPLYLAE